MISGIVRDRDIRFRLDGFGTMVGLRELPVPAGLQAGRCHRARISVYKDGEPLFRGPAEVCAEAVNFFIDGAVVALLLFIEDETILAALLHARIDIEAIGDPVEGDGMLNRFRQSRSR